MGSPTGTGRRFSMKDDPFYNLGRCASAHECTGLAPSAIRDEFEAECISSLAAIHPQELAF